MDYEHVSVTDVTVEWVAGGEHFRKQVALKGILPKSGSGKLVFVVDGTTASARFEKAR